MRSSRGFTLIELLVVVTMIVVLLALISPALDQAIYQSQLAVCGAKLHALGGSVQAYAMDQKRRYPYRPLLDRTNPPGRWPTHLVYETRANSEFYDERRIVQGYLDINGHLQCPLSRSVNLMSGYNSPATPGSGAYVNYGVMTNYSLWYGWRYKGQKGMTRVGDRVEWPDGQFVHRFRVLAADFERIEDVKSPQFIQGAHPDRDGILAAISVQDGLSGGATVGPIGAGSAKATYSHWSALGIRRGLVERNFVYEDGAVGRFSDLELDDPRLIAVPEQASFADWRGFRTWLPTD